MSASIQGIPIVGVGARTPLGLNAASTAAAVRAGITAMQEHPNMIDRFGKPMVVTADAELTNEISGVDRLVLLALAPAIEALGSTLGKFSAAASIDVIVSLPENRPGGTDNLEDAFLQQFSHNLEKEIKIREISCHGRGHAGGIACFENALTLIESGKCDFCLVGGVDSYLEPGTLEWLDSLEQLHSENTIWGFCPGEGAGFCLLASHKIVDRFGLYSPIRLRSASSAMEPNRIKTETVCIGDGLSETFKKTLSILSEDCRVSHTICDINGEPYRANEYGFAMLRNAVLFEEDAVLQTPADCWGDMGAASGPLFAVLTAFSATKGYAAGPFTLLWASSECGLRASAIIGQEIT